MTSEDRRAAALAKLVRVARQQEDDLSVLIADLQTAEQSAEASIDRIGQSIDAERVHVYQSDDAGNFYGLASFQTGAAEKRRSLEATRAQLAGEIADVKARLKQAHQERRKYERLAEKLKDAERKRQMKKEMAALDAFAQRRAAG